METIRYRYTFRIAYTSSYGEDREERIRVDLLTSPCRKTWPDIMIWIRDKQATCYHERFIRIISVVETVEVDFTMIENEPL